MQVYEKQNKELYAVLAEMRDEPQMSENKVCRARFNVYGPKNVASNKSDSIAAQNTVADGKRQRQNVPKEPRTRGKKLLQKMCDVKARPSPRYSFLPWSSNRCIPTHLVHSPDTLYARHIACWCISTN